MQGSKALIKTLIEEGTEAIFGIPGGVILPIFDALYDADVRVVLTRHEQGAIHAADGYARVTGKVGVCIATSGPGATNLVTGLATAHMDSIPIVAITGQVNTSLIGRDSFQEADITGITMPVTKHNYLVKDPDALCSTIREAFHIASTGPVLIDVPADITTMDVKNKAEGPVNLKGYKPTVAGHKKQVKNAVKAIMESERPLLYVGGGVITSGAWEELVRLARSLQCPVTHTLMGKGAFPEDDPLSLGMLGMHGTWTANTATSTADTIIAVGARFDDRVTGRIERFASDAKIIHIDVDPAEIGKNVRVAIPIVGDAKNVLKAILKELPSDIEPRKAWLDMVAEWKRMHPLLYKKDSDDIMPQEVVEMLDEITNGEAIISTEVGQNQMWACQYYGVRRPRSWLSSGGLGTMGYGFPAAVGAQVGAPDRLVVDIAGDGSIMMNIQELATAVAEKLPVKIVVLNNSYLGMVRQWQKMFYGGRYSSTDLSGNPDLAKIARAFGAEGISVQNREELEPSLKKAMTNGRPTLVDVRVSREENVMPMVPKGAALDEMIEEYKE